MEPKGIKGILTRRGRHSGSLPAAVSRPLYSSSNLLSRVKSQVNYKGHDQETPVGTVTALV